MKVKSWYPYRDATVETLTVALAARIAHANAELTPLQVVERLAAGRAVWSSVCDLHYKVQE